jgi:hypothetical protein
VRPAYRPLALAVAALAIFGAAFLAAAALGWWNPAANEQAVGEVSRWCERVSGGLLREPLNTLGNLAFIAAGLTMFGVLARDSARDAVTRNPFVGNQPLALLYASAVVFLGPGSMLMHASHTFIGAWLDNLSMVVFIVIPWLYNFAILGRWTWRGFAWSYVAIISVYAVGYVVVAPDLGMNLDLFEVSIPLWIISEFLVRFGSVWARWLSGFVGFAVALAFGIPPWQIVDQFDRYWWVVLFWLPALVTRGRSGIQRRYTPWFWLGMASFLLAFVIWTTGKATHELCRPDSVIQAHAVWHLLCAAATWCFFMFLRSQRAEGNRPDVQADSPLELRS